MCAASTAETDAASIWVMVVLRLADESRYRGFVVFTIDGTQGTLISLSIHI